MGKERTGQGGINRHSVDSKLYVEAGNRLRSDRGLTIHETASGWLRSAPVAPGVPLGREAEPAAPPSCTRSSNPPVLPQVLAPPVIHSKFIDVGGVRSVSNLSPHVGFLIEHVAGWVTHYANLCEMTERDPTVNADWHHINYYRSGGKLETLHEGKLHFVPGYVMGNLRFASDFGRALKAANYDALLTNSRIGGMLFARQLSDIPTIMEFDATPRQFDRMPAYGSPQDSPPIAYAKWRLHVRMYRSALRTASF